MAILRRKFTDEQKLAILREAEESGITVVLRNHQLSYSAFSRWREHFRTMSSTQQNVVYDYRARSELKQYKTENLRLKKIIADQALELEKREEELKRNNHSHGKK